jgi:hypothetical protein
LANDCAQPLGLPRPKAQPQGQQQYVKKLDPKNGRSERFFAQKYLTKIFDGHSMPFATNVIKPFPTMAKIS